MFATIFSFGARAVVKLGTSIILTKILYPEAYGVITVLMSIVLIVETLADIGVTVFVVRDKNAEEPRYLHTAWTIRLARAALNSIIVFSCAGPIANSIYHLPALAAPLRVISLWFVIVALESMSYYVALRRKQARLMMYSELAAGMVSAAFSVVYCYLSRDYWGLVYGELLNRVVMTLLSYRFYPESRPRLRFDRQAAREMAQLSKYTMPSGVLAVGLSQFDKIVFLRFFDLPLLGAYGLAGTIAGPVESLISKVSQAVLYPRCAHNFRADQATFATKYYTENVRLFVAMLILPGTIGGCAATLVDLIYPARYAQAGAILQAFMLRAALLALYSPAEDLLVATGASHVILVANALRASWMVAASLAGYYCFGFIGFVYGVALINLPPLLYYTWLQRQKRILILKYEFHKLALLAGFAACSYSVGHLMRAYGLGSAH